MLEMAITISTIAVLIVGYITYRIEKSFYDEK